ncbi:hypothetical protein ID866_2750 [Astraeus odoratus]|nr:hypothetical protein ID866_2750 [Astraeus odoratus]
MIVPLILFENQHLDTRLKTLAVSGGKPKFSASGLGRHGNHPPYELKLTSPDEETGASLVAAGRDDVQLPLLSRPYILPNPSRGNQTIPEGAERSHFWLSDWMVDTSPPGVDADEECGWQYAQTFNVPDEAWSAKPPPQLECLLSGSGLMITGLTSPSRTRSRGSSSTSASSSRAVHPQTWVRRRRWVRVMRRRLDIPPLPFMEPDGALYQLMNDGSLMLCESDGESNPGDPDGLELGAIPPNPLSSAQDYVARARYLVGNQSHDSENDYGALSAIEARRAIAKLERATTELRQGILGDDDPERKTQAEVLLNTYSRELKRRRLSASAQGLLTSQSKENLNDDDDDDDDDDEFHYPGFSSAQILRTPSVRSVSVDQRSSVIKAPIDLTPHLSQAAEFRVPTREAPQKMVTWSRQPTAHPVYARWERDNEVLGCNGCQRRFTFILRRHCRRCGRIFCDRCSSHRAHLDPSEIVQDPTFPEPIIAASSHRVCRSCFEELNATARPRASSSAVVQTIVDDVGRLMTPGHLTRQNSSSQLSDLVGCPVCGIGLSDLGRPADQEAHVRGCLEGVTAFTSPPTDQPARFLVYKLSAESALIGIECAICLEEFVGGNYCCIMLSLECHSERIHVGSEVARLCCLCSFHNACITSWFQRRTDCPVHAR